jgi:hypothetical protein
VPRLGYGRFLPDPFQIIMNLSIHSTLYIQVAESVVENSHINTFMLMEKGPSDLQKWMLFPLSGSQRVLRPGMLENYRDSWRPTSFSFLLFNNFNALFCRR